MNSEAWGAKKLVIVGAGAVGATFAYALAQSVHAKGDGVEFRRFFFKNWSPLD